MKEPEIIAAIKKARGLVSVAAEMLGCDRSTLTKRIGRSAKLKVALSEAREMTTDIAEGKLYSAIQKGESWAVCFYLKTQAKNRGYVERVENTGAIVNITPQELAAMTDEQLEAFISRASGGIS